MNIGIIKTYRKNNEDKKMEYNDMSRSEMDNDLKHPYRGINQEEINKHKNSDYKIFSNMKDNSLDDLINNGFVEDREEFINNYEEKHFGNKSLLEEATEIVNGSRENDYGSAFDNMKHIADIFNTITGRDLTPEEVVLLNVSQKLSREIYKHKQDNLVDLIGYIEVLNKVINDKKNNK